MRKLSFILQSKKSKKWINANADGSLVATSSDPGIATTFNLNYYDGIDAYALYNIDRKKYLSVTADNRVAATADRPGFLYAQLNHIDGDDPRAFTCSDIERKVMWEEDDSGNIKTVANSTGSFIFALLFNY